MITIGSLHRTSDPPVEPGSASAASDGQTVSGHETPEQAAPLETALPKKRVPLMAIPVTLSVGLLVAAGYVGHRIVTAKSQPAPLAQSAAVATPKSVKPAPVEPRAPEPWATVKATQPEKVQAIAPSAAETPALPAFEPVGGGDGTDLIDPQPGQRYLQIAAISSSAVSWFTADLRRANLQVRLAPGPHEGLVRVLIGPFPDWDSLYAFKAQILRMWPDTFVRTY